MEKIDYKKKKTVIISDSNYLYKLEEKKKKFWDDISKKERNWILNTPKRELINKIKSGEREEHWWEELIGKVKGNKILDIGCGNGRHVLASVSQGHETIGIDFSRNMLLAANRKLRSASLENFHLVLADASHLPFKEKSFRNVLYLATLHNIPNDVQRIKSLNEVNRVLLPSGVCLISVWKRLQFRFLPVIIKTYVRKALCLE